MHKEAIFGGFGSPENVKFCIDVLVNVKDLKTKAGKYKMKEESRKAIEDFIRFNVEQDWMESKDFTKLLKILAAAVITGCDFNNKWHESIITEEASAQTRDWKNTRSRKYGISLYSDITMLTVDRQWGLREEEYEHETDKANVRSLIKLIGTLTPIVNKANAMRKRLTRNGKFPKEEAEIRRRAAIKGALDKKLLTALTQIRIEWVKIIYKHELSWRMERSESIAKEGVLAIWNSETGVPRDDQDRKNFLQMADIIKWKKVSEDKSILVLCSQAELEKSANDAAEREGDSWLFKMADKFGGLVTGKREFLDAEYEMHGKEAFASSLTFKFANDSMIHIENKIITNRSPLNNYFYQYPCVFTAATLDGVKLKNLSELTVKEAFKR